MLLLFNYINIVKKIIFYVKKNIFIIIHIYVSYINYLFCNLTLPFCRYNFVNDVF